MTLILDQEIVSIETLIHQRRQSAKCKVLRAPEISWSLLSRLSLWPAWTAIVMISLTELRSCHDQLGSKDRGQIGRSSRSRGLA